MLNTLITFLKLTIEPFSNQTGELIRDSKLRDVLSQSQLYMIVQRKEVFFENMRYCEGVVTFDISSGTGTLKDVTFDVTQFVDDYEKAYNFEVNFLPDGIDVRVDGQMVYGSTTMGFLFNYWRKGILVGGLEDFRKFTEFELLYVGISKKEDSFTRLFERGHKNRLEILSNETQLKSDARLTDEVYMLLFHSKDLGVRSVGIGDEDVDFEAMNGPTPAKIKQIADAEKAFVSMMKTKYNERAYPNFPKGLDGLYAEGLTNYSFSIDEDITLTVGPNKLRCQGLLNRDRGPEGDFIFVRGDKVELVRPSLLKPR